MEFAIEMEKMGRVVSEANKAGSIIEDAAKFFGENQIDVSKFKEVNMTGDFKIEGTPNEYKLKYGDKIVDIEGAEAALNKGDLLTSFEKFGAPEEVLKSPEVKSYSATYENAWKQQKGIQDSITVEKTSANGQEMTKSIGEPSSLEDFQKQLDTNTTLGKDTNAKIDKLNKQLEEAKKTGNKPVEKGKWVKTTLQLGLVGLTVGTLYELINQHKAEMNGCWLINNQTGDKCKVQKLTCQQESKINENVCPANGVSFGTCKDVCSGEDITCIEGACVECNPKDENGMQTCKTRVPECIGGGGECSTYCNSNLVGCPTGYTLQCVNADFWGAAEDFTEEPFKWSGGLVTKIIDIFVKVIYVCLIILGIFLLIKFLLWAISVYNRHKLQSKNNVSTSSKDSNGAKR